ncbi:hypothetical protein CGCS363_v014844 [Colletotrichum siamense]|uniref:uncharacterized protein n=1 Tax=Colletotrichum siamense TaxID=690259 RepID=UPI0018733CCF|nr:uncharacterized protein CGCS363_v014844 [Colletotrichum siamense]KAF5485116.1 hypothetical protein CGCS363_v014844 [Colletotrichum siamense]
MGEDNADSADAVFALLVSELITTVSTDDVAVIMGVIVAPRDVSILDWFVETAMLLLTTVSNVVWYVVVGKSDGNESAVAVGVTNGKDIDEVPVVVASSKDLEIEDSVVVDEGSTDKRLGETSEEDDSSVEDEKVVVSVDKSLVVVSVGNSVAGSSDSEKVTVVVEDASVEVSVETSVEVSIDVDVADIGAG